MTFSLIFIGVLALLLALKFPIVTLVVFMSTNLFKGYLTARVDFFQRFDLTVLATLYIIFGIIVSLVKYPDDFRKIVNWPFLVMLLLGFFMLFGLFYSSAPIYGWAKSSRFLVFGGAMFLAPLLFVRNEFDVKLFLWIFILAGVLVSVATMFNIQEERGTFLEANTIGTAERIGLGILISFCFIINRRSHMLNRLVNGGLLFVSFVGLIMTGSRGALYALVLCSVIAPFFFGRKVSFYWLIPGVVVGVLGVGFSMARAEQVTGAAVRRIAVLWQYESGVESAFSTRLPFYSYAISNMPRAPLIGHGTGAFASDFGGEDTRQYPHNIVLELGYENGLVGLSLFVMLLLMVYRRWRLCRRCADRFLGNEMLYILCSIAGLIFVYLFLQALKSNDIDGNRLLFFSLGFIVSIYSISAEQLRSLSAQFYESNDVPNVEPV